MNTPAEQRLATFATQPAVLMTAVMLNHSNATTSRGPSGLASFLMGQLANYQELRREILETTDFHLARETDTEILNHLISRMLSEVPGISGLEILKKLSAELDGAWNLAFLNANGDMFVSRDPTGIRPLCYAVNGPLFAAASESVALTHLGFEDSTIKNVPPGHAVVIDDTDGVRLEKYAEAPSPSHCFFEWIYFANAASTFDDAGVYLSRKRLGEQLAECEDVPIDSDTIVVPVPDTAKARSRQHGVSTQSTVSGRSPEKQVHRADFHRRIRASR